MSSYTPNQNPSPFEIAKSQLLSQSPSRFNELLSQQTIEKAFDDANANFGEEEDALFTPTITLWGFLSQMLFKGEQLQKRTTKLRCSRGSHRCVVDCS